MKNINRIIKLTSDASEIIEAAYESNKKYEALLKYNVEVAAPNGFTPKTEDVIEFQAKVTARLMTSYFRIINEIKSFEL